MITTRPIKETDNSILLEIEKLCPQGDETRALGIDKEDIIARYRLYDNWRVLVAEYGGEVAGWTGWTIKDDPVRKSKYAYLAEVVVSPKSSGRGVGTKLVSEAEKDAKERGADYIYCYIYEPNQASKSLFQKLGYSEMASVNQSAVAVYKKANISQKISIKHPEIGDIQDIVNLINDFNKNRAHFVPFTGESFEKYVNMIPAYSMENFWVAKDGEEVVACAGLWDFSQLADLYYAKEPMSLRAMGIIFRVLGHLIKLPTIYPEGEHFNLRLLANYAFHPKNAEAMHELIKFLNNRLLESGIDCLLVVVDSVDPAFEIVKMHQPQTEIWRVYAKSLDGDLAKFSPFYVDVRDLIP